MLTSLILLKHCSLGLLACVGLASSNSQHLIDGSLSERSNGYRLNARTQPQDRETLGDFSPEQRAALQRINELMDSAGQQFKDKNYRVCGNSVRSAQQELVALAKTGVSGIHEALEKDFARIKKAQELLRKQREKFEDLKELADYKPIGFASHIAPIIVANCGQCHVDQARGRFSAASFQSLIDAGTVVSGEPEKSKLVEVIESGEMPPGRAGKVDPDDLQLIKDWIAAGGKFDGNDESQNLKTLAQESKSKKKKSNKKFR